MFLSQKRIPQHILINRVDAMGDVVLALPLCGLVKKYYPGVRLTFLGRTYTKSIAMTCTHVDDFMDRDEWHGLNSEEISALLQQRNIDTVIHLLPDVEVMKACRNAGIKTRIGGFNKLLYWKYCSRLVPYSRKKSRLSEAQLNIKLLPAIGIMEFPAREALPQYYGFSKIPALTQINRSRLDSSRLNLILHPLSNKNAKEWGLHNFSALIKKIDPQKIKIFVTGSPKEKDVLKEWVHRHQHEITDLTGALDSDQLIAFVNAADGLIASSTGPVHIAAACGIHTLGLYENRWIKRGERWGPIGKNASFLECSADDMDTITPEMVIDKIQHWTRLR